MPPTFQQFYGVESHDEKKHRPAQFLVLIDLTLPKFQSHKVIKSVHKYLGTSTVISGFSPVFCLCVASYYACNLYSKKKLIFSHTPPKKVSKSRCFSSWLATSEAPELGLKASEPVANSIHPKRFGNLANTNPNKIRLMKQ